MPGFRAQQIKPEDKFKIIMNASAKPFYICI